LHKSSITLKKLIIIFGPPAVGKMTVGVELSTLTGLKLFHNHMTIDLVLNFFDWNSKQFKLSNEFRNRIFEEVASSHLNGLIFTYVWALDDPKDKEYIDSICEIFENNGAQSYFVELCADQSVRLQRNESEFRLSQKKPKRDIKASRSLLLQNDDEHVLNTTGPFYYEDRFLKIDNTNISAIQTAQKIVDTFQLPKP